MRQNVPNAADSAGARSFAKRKTFRNSLCDGFFCDPHENGQGRGGEIRPFFTQMRRHHTKKGPTPTWVSAPRYRDNGYFSMSEIDR